MAQYKENICPKCGRDTSNLALTELLINWEMYDCEEATFSHLVEVRWHRDCFVARITEMVIHLFSIVTDAVDQIQEEVCHQN